MPLLDLIRRPQPKKGPSLTETEVAAAVHRIQTLEPFCEAEALVTNEGFGASISFRTCVHTSTLGFGAIEVGLRTTALEFRPPDGALGWGWSEAVPILVRTHRASETRLDGGTHKEAQTHGQSGEHGLEGGGGVSGGVFRAGAKATHRRIRKSERINEDQTTWSRTRSVPTDLVAMEGVRSAFTLRLTAPDTAHLGYFNADLVRQSFLHVPEPSSLDISTVQVHLKPPVIKEWGDELIHALSIQNASGAWAPLAQSRNRQILGELLLAKFLRPLHKRRRLWPHRRLKAVK